MGRITSFLSDVFAGRSLEDQLQDEARARSPAPPKATHFKAPARYEDVLRAANERTIERLKAAAAGNEGAAVELGVIAEGVASGDRTDQDFYRGELGRIGALLHPEGDPDALAKKRAATHFGPLVLKLPDDPARRAEIEAAIRENFGRNTGLLQPGETRQEDFRDGLRRVRKDPVLAMPYGRHHAAKVEQMGGVPVPPALGPGETLDFGPDNFLIFINGDARTGKDTTASLIAEAFEERGFLSEMHSSIEPVRQMLLSAGIDVSAKNEKDRKLLAEIGDLTEDYNGFRSNYCVAHFLDMAKRADAERKGAALILHTREPHTIHKIAFLCRHVPNLDVQTLFISGRGVSVQTNRADAGVRGMVYDTTIANDGTIHDLAAKCESYVDALTRNL